MTAKRLALRHIQYFSRLTRFRKHIPIYCRMMQPRWISEGVIYESYTSCCIFCHRRFARRHRVCRCSCPDSVLGSERKNGPCRRRRVRTSQHCSGKCCDFYPALNAVDVHERCLQFAHVTCITVLWPVIFFQSLQRKTAVHRLTPA